MSGYRIIEIEDINTLIQNKEFIIFGAGDRGRKYAAELIKRGCRVTAFWDNDSMKQREEINEIPVCSYDKIKKYSDYYLILGSAYAAQELTRIQGLNCIETIQFMEFDYADTWIRLDGIQNVQYYLTHNAEVKELLEDEQSKQICERLFRFMKEKDNNYLSGIASVEEHYLTHEVKEALPKGAIFIDGGAYTGEFPAALLEEKIDFDKCYSFEANAETAEKLIRNMSDLNISEKVVCVEKGLAEKTGTMYFAGEGASTCVVDYPTQNKLEVISIDDYFSDKTFDFIKMDIEGMELPSLCGGIKAIRRDRPVLAISIYHSFHDRIDIPLFLGKELEDYVFLLRQHSIWYAETVFYAIPREHYKGEKK